MSCSWQGIFLFSKNVLLVANHVQMSLCYSNTIKENVRNVKKEMEDFYNEKETGICNPLRNDGIFYGCCSERGCKSR